MSTLHDRAMLISLTIGFWGGQKKDREKTKEVLDEEQAQSDAGGWVTRIVSPKELSGISTVVSRARTFHTMSTLPWTDSGIRILPSAKFIEYREKMAALKGEFQQEVDKFIDRFPDLIAQAQRRLGGLIDTTNIPATREVREKFTWGFTLFPLPQVKDFRTDLQDDAASEIRKNMQASFDDVLKQATSEVWSRLGKAVERIMERTKDQDAVIRSSVFETAKTLVGEIPKMNITNDPQLDAIGREIMSKLASVTADDVRDNKTKRAQVAKDAGDILKRMSSYTGNAQAPAAPAPAAKPVPKPAAQAKPKPAQTGPQAPPAKPVRKAPSKPMTAAEIAKQAALTLITE